MSLILPSRANGYAVALAQELSREFFEAFLGDIHERLSTLELTEADYDAAIDAIKTQALAIVSANITEEVNQQRDRLSSITLDIDKVLAAIAAAQEGVAASTVIALAPAGFEGTTVQLLLNEVAVKIADLLTREPLPLLAARMAGPVHGATAAPVANALTLTAAPILSLYGKQQKTIRFQIASATSFAANTILYDSGVLTQAGVTASVPNTQSLFTGGTTYYVRTIQTDEDNASTGWSPATTFAWPRAANAPTISAPANGATNVGAQNQAVTFAASAYSHPNGVAQSARRFEISKDEFATIITLPISVGSTSLVYSDPKSRFTANTVYKVRAVDTDANGGVSYGPTTSFTTTASFGVGIGEAESGGFKAVKNWGRGPLEDIILAARSTENAGVRYQSGTALAGTESRVDGKFNTDQLISNFGGTSSAADYARSISIGGVAGDIPSIDEAAAISFNLRPNVAPTAAFKAGGAEAFLDTTHWSSTELDGTRAWAINFLGSQQVGDSKANAYRVRAIKRITVLPPFALGTAMEGGWLAAYFTDLSSGTPITYMLIVADKATEVFRVWQSSNTQLGTTSRTNGKQYNYSDANVYQAFAHANNTVSGGKDDWYLGAIDEMLSIARTNSFLPSAQQLSGNYWTSTEIGSATVKSISNFAAGAFERSTTKDTALFVRPIRRVLLPA